MDYIIETYDITKVYKKVPAVNRVNMHIPRGSIYGFVGENGSGKTTIMRLLTGLAELNGGSYTIMGVKNTSREIYKVRNKMAALVEAASLVPTLTALQNIKYAETYLGIKLTQERREELLTLVNLQNVGKKIVKNFSLGMKQRLAIALCLINDPEIMLLDEPMNGLDPEGIAELRNILVELNKNKGITIIISSHILSELEKIASYYGFILKGRMLEELSATELEDKCRSSISLHVDDLLNGRQVIDDLGIKNYKVYPTGEIIIFDQISVNKLVVALDKKKVNVTSFKTQNESVEDYYLNLIKEAR